MEKLSHLATPELLAMAKADPAKASEHLEWIEQFNHRFLQVNVIDADGHVVLATTRDHATVTEPANHVGAAYALDGKPYVSEPYKSATFGRYVLYMSVPVLDAAKRPAGALSLRYDLQDAMDALLSSVRFG